MSTEPAAEENNAKRARSTVWSVVIKVTLTAIGVSTVAINVHRFWPFLKTDFMSLIENGFLRFIISLVLVGIGAAFYWLRENQRLLYASAELSTAGATGFYALSQLLVNQNGFQCLLALLGAIYIVVRSFDNFNKWAASNDPTFRLLKVGLRIYANKLV